MNINKINENKKILILEWKSREFSDEMVSYENFEVISGDDRKNLFFPTDFFSVEDEGIEFKERHFFQISTFGSFVEEDSTDIIGNFDSFGIIQKTSDGKYEIEEINLSSFIKSLIERNEEIDSLKSYLEEKKVFAEKINKEFFETRSELSRLQSEFDKLQREREEINKDLNSFKDIVLEKIKDIEEREEIILNYQQTTEELKNKLSETKYEKTKLENSWYSPERYVQEKKKRERFERELEIEEKRTQKLTKQFEEFRNRDWKTTIKEKLEEKTKNLNCLKFTAEKKIKNADEKASFQILLFTQVQIDTMATMISGENNQVNQFACLMAKTTKEDQIKKLASLSLEEKKSLCEAQTEVTKLQIQLNQWENIEKCLAQQEHITNN